MFSARLHLNMVKMDPLTRWVCPKPIGKPYGVFPLVEVGEADQELKLTWTQKLMLQAWTPSRTSRGFQISSRKMIMFGGGQSLSSKAFLHPGDRGDCGDRADSDCHLNFNALPAPAFTVHIHPASRIGMVAVEYCQYDHLVLICSTSAHISIHYLLFG